MVHRTNLIFVKDALLLLVEAGAYAGSERAGRKAEGWPALGWNKSGFRLLWFFPISQEAALSPLGRGFLLFIKSIPKSESRQK